MTHHKNPSRRKLIDAALEHLALERIAACAIQVPDTEPPLFVAVGQAPAVVHLLQDDVEFSLPPLPKASGEFRGERIYDVSVMRDYARAALAGRGKPMATANIEFDHSEGGHHD